jgi:branched-chain amino acid transport system ATP-binding protein
MKKEILLKLENIHVNYDGLKALNGASIELDEGEIIVLMGPNGAGKSTILKALFGLSSIESGKIYWHEKEIVPKPNEMVERGISFVPQGRQVFKSLSVLENLEVGGFSIKSKTLLKERIESVLDIFPDLRKKIKESAKNLSGGQQQMLAIARGLITDPKVLLLDEPTLGLSPKIVKEVFKKVKEINQRNKTAVVIVEHNLKSVLEITDRVYVLDKGIVIKKDSSKNMLNSNMFEKVFLN